MKRIVTLLLAAGLVFGAFGGAQAADIKAKGQWDFNFEFLNNTDFQSKEHGGQGGDTFAGKQRLRTQIDIVASESLSGTVYFEMGDTIWGKEDGALGADGKSVEVKRSYIDWIVPNTDLKVRMGIQGLALPGFVAGSPVLDDDVAAITMSYAFNDMVAATAFWARPYDTGGDNNSVNSFDEMDLFGLIVPVTLDGMKIQPWAMYSSIGKNIALGDLADSKNPYNTTSSKQAAAGLRPAGAPATGQLFDKDTTAWWGGLSYELSMFDPIRLKIDGILLTMVDHRTNYAKEISALIRETYSDQIKVFATDIPFSIRAAEISAEGKSIYAYDPKGKAAEAYRELTKEVLRIGQQREKAKSDIVR